MAPGKLELTHVMRYGNIKRKAPLMKKLVIVLLICTDMVTTAFAEGQKEAETSKPIEIIFSLIIVPAVSPEIHRPK
jgi:hypothetical protein